MRNYCLLFILLSLLSSCHRQPAKEVKHVTLSGILSKGDNDTLYIYGNDIFFDKVDTIVSDSTGHFQQVIPLDTLIWGTLVYHDSITYPIFMDKGDNIAIQLDNKKKETHLHIKGNENNRLIQDFYAAFPKDSISEDTIKRYAQEFIEKHPNKIASLYVLNEYFANVEKPSTSDILRIIDILSGELQDRAYVIELRKKAEAGIVEENNSLPYFTMNNMNGQNISRSDYYSKGLLLYFWASWDENSIREMTTIKKMVEKCNKSKGCKALGVSLDLDKDAWIKAIKKEKLDKQQICDFKGWNSDFIQQIKIHKLPTVLLIDRYGTIRTINPSMEKLEKAIKEYNEQEKNTRHIYN